MAFPWTPPSKPKNAPPLIRYADSVDVKWSRSYPARLARTAIVEAGWRPIVSTFARPERRGLDRLKMLDPNSPVVFTANHRSHADTPILLTSIPEPWRHKLAVGAAKDYFFGSPVTAAFFALTIGAIPIERTKIDRSSADLVGSLIKKGWSLLLYPEGGRSPDGWGKPFRAGAAYIAAKHNVPIVPIYMEGTRDVLPVGRYFPKVARSSLIFGDPVFQKEAESTKSFATRVSDATDELADELATDWWTAKKRKHNKSSPSTHGPETVSWRRIWSLPLTKKVARPTARHPWR